MYLYSQGHLMMYVLFFSGDGMNAYMAYKVSTQVKMCHYSSFYLKLVKVDQRWNIDECLVGDTPVLCSYRENKGCDTRLVEYWSKHEPAGYINSINVCFRPRCPCFATRHSQWGDASATSSDFMRSSLKNMDQMDSLCLHHQRRASWVGWRTHRISRFP